MLSDFGKGVVRHGAGRRPLQEPKEDIAMKKTIVGMTAAFAVANLLAASPTPYARWMPDLSVTAEGGGSLPDATGGGHSLTFGAGFNPLSGDMRGVVFCGQAVGGTYGKFDCPSLRSRAFALWIKPDSGQHTYTQSDLACLLNGFSGMTVYCAWQLFSYCSSGQKVGIPARQ